MIIKEQCYMAMIVISYFLLVHNLALTELYLWHKVTLDRQISWLSSVLPNVIYISNVWAVIIGLFLSVLNPALSIIILRMFLAGICDQSAGSPSEDHDTTTTHPVLYISTALQCTVYTCICQVMPPMIAYNCKWHIVEVCTIQYYCTSAMPALIL